MPISHLRARRRSLPLSRSLSKSLPMSLPFVDISLQRSATGRNTYFSFSRQVSRMTMAAAMQSRTAELPARSKGSRIAHVDIVRDPSEVEKVWRAFEEPGHLSTPYQRFDLLSPCQQLVGGCEGARPFIVIARDAEHRPLLLL